MKKYYSNQKKYYGFKKNNILEIFAPDDSKINDSELNELMTNLIINLEIGYNIEDENNEILFISEDEYENFKKKIQESLKTYYENIEKKVNNGEELFIAKREEQIDTYKKLMLELKNIDEKDNLSFEAEDFIEVKFSTAEKTVETKLNFDEEITYKYIDDDDISMTDVKLINKMKNNIFFQNLIKKDSQIIPIKCDHFDRNNNSFLLKLQDTEIIISRKEAKELLEQFKDYQTEETNNFNLNSFEILDETNSHTARSLKSTDINVDIDDYEIPVPKKPKDPISPTEVKVKKELSSIEKMKERIEPLGYEIKEYDEKIHIFQKDNQDKQGFITINDDESITGYFKNKNTLLYRPKNVSIEDFLKEIETNFEDTIENEKAKINKSGEILKSCKESLEENENVKYKNLESSTNIKEGLIILAYFEKSNGDTIICKTSIDETFENITIKTKDNEYTIDVNRDNYLEMFKKFVENENIEDIKNSIEKNNEQEVENKEKKDIRTSLNECIQYIDDNYEIIYKNARNDTSKSGNGLARIAILETQENEYKLYFSDEECYIEIKDKSLEKPPKKIELTSENALEELKESLIKLETKKVDIKEETITLVENSTNNESKTEKIDKNLEEFRKILEKNNFEYILEDSNISFKKQSFIGTISKISEEKYQLAYKTNESENLNFKENLNFSDFSEILTTFEKTNLSKEQETKIVEELKKYSKNSNLEFKEDNFIIDRRYASLKNPESKYFSIENRNFIGCFEINEDGTITGSAMSKNRAKTLLFSEKNITPETLFEAINTNFKETKQKDNLDEIFNECCNAADFGTQKFVSKVIFNIGETNLTTQQFERELQITRDEGDLITLKIPNKFGKNTIEIKTENKTIRKEFSENLDPELIPLIVREISIKKDYLNSQTIEQTLEEITNLKKIIEVNDFETNLNKTNTQNIPINIKKGSIEGTINYNEQTNLYSIKVKDISIKDKNDNVLVVIDKKNFTLEELETIMIDNKFFKNKSFEKTQEEITKETITIDELNKFFKEKDYNTIIRNGELQVYNASFVGFFKLEDGKICGRMNEDGIQIYEKEDISVKELKTCLENDFKTEKIKITNELINFEETLKSLDFEVNRDKESLNAVFSEGNTKFAIDIKYDKNTQTYKINTTNEIDKNSEVTINYEEKSLEKIKTICEEIKKEKTVLKDCEDFLQSKNIKIETPKKIHQKELEDSYSFNFENDKIQGHINFYGTQNSKYAFYIKDNYGNKYRMNAQTQEDLIEKLNTCLETINEKEVAPNNLSPLEQCKKELEELGFKTSINDEVLHIERNHFKGDISYNTKKGDYTICYQNKEDTNPKKTNNIPHITGSNLDEIINICNEPFKDEHKVKEMIDFFKRNGFETFDVKHNEKIPNAPYSFDIQKGKCSGTISFFEEKNKYTVIIPEIYEKRKMETIDKIIPELKEVFVKEKEKIETFNTVEYTREKFAQEKLKPVKEYMESIGYKTSFDKKTLLIDDNNTEMKVTYNQSDSTYNIFADSEGEDPLNIKHITLEEIKEALKPLEIENELSSLEQFKKIFENYGFEIKIKENEIQIDKNNMFGNIEFNKDGTIICEIAQLERGIYTEIYKVENENINKIKEDLDKIFTQEADAGEDKDKDMVFNR